MAEDTVRRQWLWRRVRALRTFSFPVSVGPVLVATAAALPPARWRWDVLAASVLAAALLHGAGNLLNDYFDVRSGVDARKGGDDGARPGRLLVRGTLKPREVLMEAAACLALTLPLAGYIGWRCGPAPLLFAAAGALALYAYTGPPFHLKYRALGEPLIFLVFGPLLMLGSAWAQTGRWEWAVFRLSIPIGWATTAILVGNNIRDFEEDSAAGITTLIRVIGLRAGRILYAGLVLAALLGVAALAMMGLAPPMLLLAPGLVLLHLGPLLAVLRGNRIPDIDARTARFEGIFLLFLLAVLVACGRSAPT